MSEPVNQSDVQGSGAIKLRKVSTDSPVGGGAKPGFKTGLKSCSEGKKASDPNTCTEFF